MQNETIRRNTNNNFKSICTATYPLDLTKTRLQIQGEATSSAASLSSTKSASANIKQKVILFKRKIPIRRYIQPIVPSICHIRFNTEE